MVDVADAVGEVVVPEGAVATAVVVADAVGDGLGVTVAVVHSGAVASGRAVLLVPRVSAVVPRTPATTHNPVAMVAKVDPWLRGFVVHVVSPY